MTRFAIFLLSALYASNALPQTPSKTDPWGPLRSLEGHWQGAISGKLGTGTGVRHYEFILDGNFLTFRHASVREPQEQSPEGDHHRELSVFSFDSERQKIVLRSFNVEGFVLQYLCNVSDTKITCESERVESGPGFRARAEIDIKSPYEFTERFSLAEPGKDLELYFTNRWIRAPKLR
jgi:hypothetical protein